MKRFAWLASLICLACAPAVAETLRHGMTESAQAEWLAVGRLNVQGQGFCTATLVAPDIVLTAAHCLVDKRTNRVVAPERVHFLAGYRIGKYAAHGRGAQVSLVDGFSRDSQTISSDLGLVRLAEALPSRIEPMTLETRITAGDQLDVMSYAIDRAHLPSLQGACEVLRRTGTILFTSCEGVPGVSGAPLIRLTEQGPRVAGVASSVSARARNPRPKGNIVAIAADPLLTDDLLDNLGRDRDTLARDF